MLRLESMVSVRVGSEGLDASKGRAGRGNDADDDEDDVSGVKAKLLSLDLRGVAPESLVFSGELARLSPLCVQLSSADVPAPPALC